MGLSNKITSYALNCATAFFIVTYSFSASAQSGSAAGGNSADANPELEYCNETLGTLALYENQNDTWWHTYYSRYPNLGSTVPALRMIVQQSNCFVVVERGKALRNVLGERDLQDSGELREGSDFGKGQLVSADYTMSPSIQFSQNTGGIGGALGGIIGKRNPILGGAIGKLKRKQAATTLLLVDNRSSVQVAASVGQAKRFNFSAGLGGISRSAAGVLGGYTETPEGKIIIAAFADSYNKMVVALRNYKAQTVEGGLGKGGKLKIGE